jgi:cystathionine beta-lyase/cystathionine gamma-synthase
MHDSDCSIETLITHYAEEEKLKGAVVPPLFQNSLFLFERVQDLVDAMAHDPLGPPHHYSRISNPTLDVVERKIAKLEGTDRAKVFQSGMGALAAATISCVQAGSHVVLVDTVYGPHRKLVTEYLARFGVSHTLVSGLEIDEIREAIRPETSLICLESPSSLVFRLQDIRAVAAIAKERGIATMIDNTYSTPLFQQPAAMGVDLIVHSATKYIGGHSDVVAGVVCGSEERIRRLAVDEGALLGAVAAPFTAWLLLRGLRTLPLRMARHQATANAVAAWLETQPFVDRVLHPGLPDFPQRALVEAQMKGTAGLFSFVPKSEDRQQVLAFVDALQWFGIGVSWGGHESLAIPIHVHPMSSDPHWVVRLSCGLEAPEDLIADLTQAAKSVGWA